MICMSCGVNECVGRRKNCQECIQNHHERKVEMIRRSHAKKRLRLRKEREERSRRFEELVKKVRGAYVSRIKDVD